MSVPGATQPVEDASAKDTPQGSTTEGDPAAGEAPAAPEDPAGREDPSRREETARRGETARPEEPEDLAVEEQPSAGERRTSGEGLGSDPAADEAGPDQQETYENTAYDQDPYGEYQDTQYEGDQYGYEDAERRPLSALAVATLVTGLLALVPLALTLGVIALALIRRSGKRGARLAVAGIYAAWIWLLVAAAVAALAYFTHGFRPRERVQYRPAAAYSLQPGQCLNGDPNATSFTTVSCASTHQAEVYGRLTLSGTAAYPGAGPVREEAAQGCASRLSAYADPRLASIGFSQEYVYPDQPAWAAGERTVICMARFGTGIAGSIRKT